MAIMQANNEAPPLFGRLLSHYLRYQILHIHIYVILLYLLMNLSIMRYSGMALLLLPLLAAG